jgi:Flp pilus assembly protein TadD
VRLLWAIIFASAALAQDRDVEQLFPAAVRAQQRGDFTTAVRDYRELLAAHPDLPDARANLGAALVHLGRFDEAIAEYRTALHSLPNDAAIRLNLALAYYKKGDFHAAITELETLHAAEPGNRKIATLLADSYSKLGDNARAVATLSPLAPQNPGDLDLAFVLGSALTRTGKSVDGAALLEVVGKQANSADAYLLAGSALLTANENARALVDLQAAMRLNPDLPGVLTQLGIAEEGNGDDPRAERDLRKALDANPTDFDASIHLGGILFTRRDLDQARIYIQRALRLRPASMFATYELALLESAEGHPEAAAADLEKVIQADPNWLDAHVQLAALYYKLRRPADGLRQRQIVERLTAEQAKQPVPAPQP